MVETMNSTKNSMIIEDTKFIIKYIEDNVDIKKKIGIVGYCMSGRFVVSVAAVFNKRIRATASFTELI